MAYSQELLLRRWLMKHGHHPDDISHAIHWFEREVAKGVRTPSNPEVWSAAVKSARENGRALDNDAEGQELKVQPKLSWRAIGQIWVAAFTGAIFGGAVSGYIMRLLNG